MIRIAPLPPEPPTLSRKKVTDHKAKLKKRAHAKERIASADFNNYWGNKETWYVFTARAVMQLETAIPAVKNLIGLQFNHIDDLAKKLEEEGIALTDTQKEEVTYTIPRLLWEHQHHKCCFCETQLSDWTHVCDVEHFRPKAGVKEAPNHLGYWWRAYTWGNLLLACKACNGKKLTQFPLLDESKRAIKEKDIPKERPVLIHPIEEDPESFFEYTKVGLQILVSSAKNAKEQEHRATLNHRDLTALNNPARCQSRYDTYKGLIDALEAKVRHPDSAASVVKSYTHSRAPFAGMCRFFIRQKFPELAAYIV